MKSCTGCRYLSMNEDMEPFCMHEEVLKDYEYGLFTSVAVQLYCGEERRMKKVMSNEAIKEEAARPGARLEDVIVSDKDLSDISEAIDLIDRLQASPAFKFFDKNSVLKTLREDFDSRRRSRIVAITDLYISG